jgi:hypothetical protein
MYEKSFELIIFIKLKLTVIDYKKLKTFNLLRTSIPASLSLSVIALPLVLLHRNTLCTIFYLVAQSMSCHTISLEIIIEKSVHD